MTQMQPGNFTQIIQAVEAADHQLSGNVYHALSAWFAACQEEPSGLREIQAASREYRKVEFFLNVNPKGEAAVLEDALLQDFEQMRAHYPTYSHWFQRAEFPDGRPTLLIARWLCHLVGLRHQAVHLFIDHPRLLDHTLIQMRSLNKAESPGRFDLPAAGHVTGLETVEAALQKELREELDVDVHALLDLTRLGSYLHTARMEAYNVEYRVVFYSRLSAEDWLRLSAGADEVAAIVSLPAAKLHEFIARRPEQVASGLVGSFPFYLKHLLLATD